MPYIHCPECFGDPLETGKAPWQLVDVEEIGDIFTDGYYKCSQCGGKFELIEFNNRWAAIEEEMCLEEERERHEQELIEQGIIDDPYSDDDYEEFDEYGRPY